MRQFSYTLTFLTSLSLFAGNAPTGFIPNKGQIHDQDRKPNPAVKYLLNGAGMNVQLRADGFSYDTYVLEESERANERESEVNGEWLMENAERREEQTSTTYLFHRVDLRFVGGNQNAVMVTEGESDDYLNYYTDVAGEAGATFVYSYSTVTYHNVWPNIDVRFNSGEEGFKYDVVVRPGGNLADVRFEVEGAIVSESLKGTLVFNWADGSLEESIPDSWFETGRKRDRVQADYAVHTDGSFGFKLREYGTGTLVIDPFPTNPWATYCGGNGEETGTAVVQDGLGNIYMAGSTTSTNVIATAGAHDVTHNGARDAFLVKYNAAGTKLWGTYCGGSGTDLVYDVAAEVGGIAAICGSTSSNSGIATAGVHQSIFAGGSTDAFLVRFQTNGTRLWGSYLGGAATDYASGIDAGTNGDLVICGSTTSTSGIASAGAADASYGGNTDGFLAQFTPSGARSWGTYLGGTATDVAYGVDFTGNYPVICGYTSSTSGIATAGAYDATHNGMTDAFIARYSASGAKLSATYYGGTGDDKALDVAFNALDRVVFVGSTTSYTQIASSGAAQPVFGGGSSDGFIVCFNLSAFNRVWGTYCGGPIAGGGLGSLPEGLIGVSATIGGGVAVVGRPFSSNLGTVDSWEPTGTDDLGSNPTFVAGYSSAGGKQWAGYPRHNKGNDIAGSASAVVVAGEGIQTNPLITPPNAHQPGWGGGGSDAFLTMLDITGGSALATSASLSETGAMKAVISANSLALTGELLEQSGEILVLDAMGRELFARPWAGGSVAMDMPVAFTPGVYIAALRTAEGTVESIRFVIN